MRRLIGGLVAVAWSGIATAAGAHPAYLTAAEITVEADGSFHGQARFDTLAFALNDTSARIGNEPMESLLAGPREELAAQLAEAKDRFQHGFRLVTDAGDAALDRLDFPSAEAVLAWRDRARPVLPVVIPVVLGGHLPEGARTVAARFPPVLEQVVLTIQRPGEEPDAQAVQAGAISPALPLRLAAEPPPITDHPVAPAGDAPSKASNRKTGLFVSLFTLTALSFLGLSGWRRRGPA